MKRCIGILSLVIAMMIIFGTAEMVTAYAAEADRSASTELTGLVLKDVDGPVVGMPLDQTATVASAEGVTWEIPVVWIDQNGNEATIADAVKGYIPTFAFYVPEGNTVKTDENGAFSIKLPAFLETLLGYDNLIFVVDKEKRITYITFNPEKVKVIRSYDPANDYTDSSESSSTPSTSSTHDTPAHPTATEKEVEIHCTPNAIERIGTDNLKDLVYIIKNVIEPRAVSALTTAFPAFAEAADNGEIGKEIALYVYDSNVDKADADERNNESAVAYISGGYFAETTYCYILGVNTSTLFEIKDGEVVLIESQLETLENTITHENLHGIMDDYLRTGMASYDYDRTSVKNHFPMWFMEGSATSVENGFQYWKDYFNQAKENGSFTNESLAKTFRGENDQHSFYRLDDGTEDPLFGSYGGGSLAIVYLSQLISQPDAGITGETVTAQMVRDGLNTILKELHNGTPLDTIIKERTRFTGIDDFENRFLKADDPSATFCAEYLNRLDEVGGDGERAAGSILLDLDSTKTSVLDGRTEDSSTQKALVIIEENEYNNSKSTVPDAVAKATAGVRNTWQVSDNPKDPSEEADQDVAAKPILRALNSTEDVDSAGITDQQEANAISENVDTTGTDADIVTSGDIPAANENNPDEEDIAPAEESTPAVEPAPTEEMASATEPAPEAEASATDESTPPVEPEQTTDPVPAAESEQTTDSVPAAETELTADQEPDTEPELTIESAPAAETELTAEQAPAAEIELTTEPATDTEPEPTVEEPATVDESEDATAESSEDVSYSDDTESTNNITES